MEPINGQETVRMEGKREPRCRPFLVQKRLVLAINNISIIMGSLAKQRRPTGRMFGEGFLLVIYAMINGRIYVLYNCLFFEKS